MLLCMGNHVLLRVIYRNLNFLSNALNENAPNFAVAARSHSWHQRKIPIDIFAECEHRMSPVDEKVEILFSDLTDLPHQCASRFCHCDVTMTQTLSTDLQESSLQDRTGTSVCSHQIHHCHDGRPALSQSRHSPVKDADVEFARIRVASP